MDTVKQNEEFKKRLHEKDTQLIQLQEAIYNFEEENKKMQNQILDECLAKEEAEKQMNAIQDQQRQADRSKQDIKSMQTTAVKKLERELEEKEQIIMGLKSQVHDNEIKALENENELRDELDLLKDKNNKLLQVEATLDVYKNRLKEIPELKAKLSMALKTNIEYENYKNEQTKAESEKEELQECIAYLKEQITQLKDQESEKDIYVARMENETKEAKRQRAQMEENMQALNQNMEELRTELARGGSKKKRPTADP